MKKLSPQKKKSMTRKKTSPMRKTSKKKIFKKHNLQGGDLLARGGQGCIFYPAVFTNEKYTSNTKDIQFYELEKLNLNEYEYVSKIAIFDEVEQESNVTEKLKQLDYTQQYGVYAVLPPIEIDYLKMKKLYDDLLKTQFHSNLSQKTESFEDFQECKETFMKQQLRGNNLYMLVLPKFIADLYAFDVKNVDGKFLFLGLQHIWEGLSFFHYYNWIHGDIKLENIAVFNDTFKFADFGFSCSTQDFESMSKTYSELTNQYVFDPKKGKLDGIYSPIVVEKKNDLYIQDYCEDSKTNMEKYNCRKNTMKLMLQHNDIFMLSLVTYKTILRYKQKFIDYFQGEEKYNFILQFFYKINYEEKKYINYNVDKAIEEFGLLNFSFKDFQSSLQNIFPNFKNTYYTNVTLISNIFSNNV